MSEGKLIGDAFEARSLVVLYFSAMGTTRKSFLYTRSTTLQFHKRGSLCNY